jgi:hypothetical protein
VDRERAQYGATSSMLRVKHRLDRQSGPPENDEMDTVQRTKSHRLLFDAYLDPHSTTSLSPHGLRAHNWPAAADEVTGETLTDIR